MSTSPSGGPVFTIDRTDLVVVAALNELLAQQAAHNKGKLSYRAPENADNHPYYPLKAIVDALLATGEADVWNLTRAMANGPDKIRPDRDSISQAGALIASIPGVRVTTPATPV